MQKAYNRINWENYPSTETAVNEVNLNRMDYALDEVDNRVITLDTTKLNLSEAYTMVKNWSLNPTNGVITVTYLNGSTTTFDTKLEKIAINFSYDAERERLVITLDDGTVQYVNISSLISQYEFADSATVAFSVNSAHVTAEVKNGSITSNKLQPNYLASITLQADRAEQEADNAEAQATIATQASDTALEKLEQAEDIMQSINDRLSIATFEMNDDGELIYTDNSAYVFEVDDNGNLLYELDITL